MQELDYLGAVQMICRALHQSVPWLHIGLTAIEVVIDQAGILMLYGR